MSYFPKFPEFYAFAIHLIYAVLLASSFEIIRDSVIPFSNIKTCNDIVHVLSIVFVYMILISGWIGYTKSISSRPHTNTKLGNIRFVLDLCIIFFTFYAINLTDDKIYRAHYGEMFEYILPIIFGLYFCWDVVKILEYYRHVDKSPFETKINISRTRITFIFFYIIMMQKFLLFDLTNIFLKNTLTIYLILTLTSFAIIMAYRINKWNVFTRTHNFNI